jgi:hypothetical protein
MKKPVLNYFWIFVILFAGFSCSDEIENPIHLDILGTWEMHTAPQENAPDFILQYTFLENGQMEFNRLYKEKDSSKTRGYHSSYEGTYSIDGNVLTPYFSKYFYKEPESSATDLEKKELMEEAVENLFVASYSVVFNENKDEVTFHVICPPHVRCTGGGVYKKAN